MEHLIQNTLIRLFLLLLILDNIRSKMLMTNLILKEKLNLKIFFRQMGVFSNTNRLPMSNSTYRPGQPGRQWQHKSLIIGVLKDEQVQDITFLSRVWRDWTLGL